MAKFGRINSSDECDDFIVVAGDWKSYHSKIKKERDDSLDEVTWLRTGDSYHTPHHLSKANLPVNLALGTYTIYIRQKVSGTISKECILKNNMYLNSHINFYWSQLRV